jgi:hypothetical protein
MSSAGTGHPGVHVDARFCVAAADLGYMDAHGGSLADGARLSVGGALGEGCFGKVGTFSYHGAAVAVKELKSDALDATSICKHVRYCESGLLLAV